MPIKCHLQKDGEDRLALGTSMRLMHIAFDRNHLLAAETADQLLSDIDGNRFVPPTLSIGFHYRTGTPKYGNPVQFIFAGSLAKFLPFQDRFNTLTFDRATQWYGLMGLEIAASNNVFVQPSMLISRIGRRCNQLCFACESGLQPIGMGHDPIFQSRILDYSVRPKCRCWLCH